MSDPKPASRVRDQYALYLFRLQHLGEPCERCEQRIGRHVHHRTFRSQGGDDVAENLEWLCGFCHADIHSSRLSRYSDVQ